MWETTWRFLWEKGNNEIHPSQVNHSEDRTTYHEFSSSSAPSTAARLSFPHHKGSSTGLMFRAMSHISGTICWPFAAILHMQQPISSTLLSCREPNQLDHPWEHLHLSDHAPHSVLHQLAAISTHNLKATTTMAFSLVAETSWWMFWTEMVETKQTIKAVTAAACS